MSHYSTPLRFVFTFAAAALAGTSLFAEEAVEAEPASEEVRATVTERFSIADTQETPDFQQHVVPLFGKLGCNGRACHGSFQGQGGFQLSLFGYDFKMDHENLTKGDEPRVSLEKPAESLFLQKPTMQIQHEGGERMTAGSWQYRLLEQWVKGGAKGIDEQAQLLDALEVTPSEIVFGSDNQPVQLKAVAVWADGTREDVTPLCRFQTNDDGVADITVDGSVTTTGLGDTHVVVFYDTAVIPVPVLRPVSDRLGPQYPETPTPTKIDELVVEKLRKLGIVQSDVASDAEFLRRVSLDMTGTLPSAKEVEAFLSDSTADKRARKIDELLERPAYTAWWTTQICDMTGNNSDSLVNVTPQLGASQDWYDWIYRRVEQNEPYNKLVAGILLSTGREKEQSYADYTASMSKLYNKTPEGSYADRETMGHFWARRNVRQPEEKALSFAYSFMGIRIQCAQCHKHPFDQWTQDDYKQFTNFFNRIRFGVAPDSREERNTMLASLGVDKLKGGEQRRELAAMVGQGKVVPFDEVFLQPAPKAPVAENPKRKNKNNKNKKRNPAAAAVTRAKLLGDERVDLVGVEDPRAILMAWLEDKDNFYFARAFVNRVWASYFKTGIVNPPDDLSLANPPVNKALLDYLANGFVEHNYDMKWLHREIANSRTYQLSWEPNDTNKLDERNFSRQVPRRLPAEVAYDAIQFATGSDKAQAALQGSNKDRAIAVSGVGRRVRRGPTFALTVFGKSTRESNCDCDRSNETNLMQTVFLRNDQETLAMIDRNDGWLKQMIGVSNEQVAAAEKTPAEMSKREAKKGNKQQNPKRLAQRLKKLEADLKAAKDANAPADEIAQLERQIGRAKKAQQAAASGDAKPEENGKKKKKKGKKNGQPEEPVAAPEVAGPAITSFDADAVVRQAYLRTLSRFPNETELATAKQHLTTVGDLAEGGRDLMWALLNTKEFIANH